MPEASFASVRVLLVVHAVVGFATVATSTHFAVTTLRAGRPRLRLYALLAASLAALQWMLGAWLYPTFRLRVREFLLQNAREAIALFEFKEHAALLAVALLTACAALTRVEAGRISPRLVSALAVTAAVATWIAALAGTWVTAIRSVGWLP